MKIIKFRLLNISEEDGGSKIREGETIPKIT